MKETFLPRYFAAAAGYNDPSNGGGLATQEKTAEVAQSDDNDFELPATAASGQACGLGDGAICEACQ